MRLLFRGPGCAHKRLELGVALNAFLIQVKLSIAFEGNALGGLVARRMNAITLNGLCRRE
jgi:hypothetical protein